MQVTDLVVYGDFNCPFCYALNEILFDTGLSDRVQWRSIEHMPGVGGEHFTPDEQSALASEVFTVRHRAPDIHIAIPPCRPNTALANRLLFNVSEIAPGIASALRCRIYRALWIEGQDISKKRILLNLLAETDAEFCMEDPFAEHNTLEQWQLTWEGEEFEGRIPVLVNDGRLLKGLSNPAEIQRFIGGEVVTENPESSCYIRPRQNVAILGELRSLWHYIETLRHEYHLHMLNSVQAVQQMVKSNELPDLILIDMQVAGDKTLGLCDELKQEERTRAIPLVLVVDHISVDEEVRAYQIGVADYMKRDRASEVFKARIDMLLQLKLTRDALDQAARLDSLTQIYNRREFDRALEMEWRRSVRSRSALSLLMVDIDYFKKYNDRYGHLAGDGCIRMLAQTMKDSTDRVGDLVCRYGGEEFAVLLPDTNAEGAYQVARNIQRKITALNIPHDASDVADHVTVSIGCNTVIPVQSGDPLKLVGGADERLYKAKHAGRDCIMGDWK